MVLAEQADSLHQQTLSDFGLWLKERGWLELEEMIKGISPQSERTRVRTGLAQLFEYRLRFGGQKDGLCLVTSRPIHVRRLRLLDSLGIGHAYVEDGKVTISGTKSSRAIFGR